MRKLPISILAAVLVIGGAVAYYATRQPAKTARPADARAADARVQRPADAAVARPAPDASPTVLHEIESEPPGADVYRLPDNVKVGTTRMDLTVNRSDKPLRYAVRMDGYQEQTVELDTEGDRSTFVQLERAKGKSKHR